MRLGSSTGLYDVRFGEDMHVLIGCGLGGGSLINAGVALRPDERMFRDPVWPDEVAHDGLLGVAGVTEAEARARWRLAACLILHRYGRLKPCDNIVLVLTASAHRETAFAAAEFLMDYLKTSAPFWKRESGPDGSNWVEADARDEVATARWDETKDAAE